MKVFVTIISFFLFTGFFASGQDSLSFNGQFSLWTSLSNAGDLPLWGGLRYLPGINYEVISESNVRFDSELTANLSGYAGLHPFDSLNTSYNIKPYRAWMRFSSDQYELRIGLQKISFGSASILRPLMWFDQIDPRDPLQLTDGVWGLLGRYYFLNNANIWLWILYGNSDIRGWEIIPPNKEIPEFGGRIQLPIPSGEFAITYHNRTADSRHTGQGIPEFERINENKIGFDAKWDLTAGIWVEGSLTHKNKNTGLLTNQMLLNTGIDYTFGIGNGIYTSFEQLLACYGENFFSYSTKTSFSLITANYPVGMFDRLGAIFFYNWDDNNLYSYISWQRQFDTTSLYVMAYWNPESEMLPFYRESQNITGGKGIRVLFVFNH